MQETSKKWLLVILSVLCLAFAGGGIYFFTENNKCNDKFKQLDNISTGCIEELRESGITGLTIGDTKAPVSKGDPTLNTEYCTDETQLCLKHPDSWLVAKTPFSKADYAPEAGNINQTITFHNQFGTPVFEIQNKPYAYGFECMPEESENIKLSIIEVSKLNDSLNDPNNNATAYAVIGYYTQENYPFVIPIVAITSNTALTSTKTAASVNICDIDGKDHFMAATASSSSPNGFFISEIGGEPIENKSTHQRRGFFFRDEKSIKEWLESGDGAVMYEILKTAYIKK